MVAAMRFGINAETLSFFGMFEMTLAANRLRLHVPQVTDVGRAGHGAL